MFRTREKTKQNKNREKDDFVHTDNMSLLFVHDTARMRLFTNQIASLLGVTSFHLDATEGKNIVRVED